MAKKVIEKWESDVINGAIFTTEKDMRDFDKKINDKDFYLEIAKSLIEVYCDEVEIDNYDIGDNGIVTLNLTMSLADKMTYILENGDLVAETCFHSIVDDIDNYDEDDDVDEEVAEYLCKKIDEFADDINKLITFKVK